MQGARTLCMHTAQGVRRGIPGGEGLGGCVCVYRREVDSGRAAADCDPSPPPLRHLARRRRAAHRRPVRALSALAGRDRLPRLSPREAARSYQ
eukprot:COSAG01_NODE_9201_length_2522_cov_8.782088_2_plen_93_part_00